MSGAGPSAIAIQWFVAIVLTTLAITYWAARRAHSRSDFYVAGGNLGGGWNGLAIAGDFLSASSILGIPAMVFVGGSEALVYVTSNSVGMALTLLLIVEPLRRLGRYTVADVIAARHGGRSLRVLTATISLTISLFYLIAQMVAAGALIQILFGIHYDYGVSIVAVLMMVYVIFGGMVVTTWVQIVKAGVMIAGVVLLTFLTLRHAHFDLPGLYRTAAARLVEAVHVGARDAVIGNAFAAWSIGAAVAFGIPGLPHLLIRMFTVPDAVQARRSMAVAMYITGLVATLVLLVLSYGALAFVRGQPALFDAGGALAGGANMAVVHLARTVGGEALFGFIAAVLFATILAVVSGLTMASAGALAHDIYAQAVRQGKVSEQSELGAFRLSTVVVTVAAIALALLFQGRNVTFMVGLAFAVAASANFPVLFLSLYWRGLTRHGAFAGGVVGLATSIGLIVVSPTVWVDVLHHPAALFPSAYPTLVAMPLAFLAAWVGSVVTRES